MPDSYAAFINYRTGDEETAASFIHADLSRRFGENRIFFASESIRPGENFTKKLLSAVRRSDVLLAVIGTSWADVPRPEEGPAPQRKVDWTHREIREAMACGIPVVPVLVGKRNRLRHDELPPTLATLADSQYLRFNHRTAATDLGRIADDVAQRVPGLVDLVRAAEKKAAADARPNENEAGFTVGDVEGSVTQVRGVAADQVNFGQIGSVLNRPTGPVQTSPGGYQFNGGEFSGGGMSFFNGQNNGKAQSQERDREDGSR